MGGDASYYKHQDGCGLLNSPSSQHPMLDHRGVPFPTNLQLAVFTLSIGPATYTGRTTLVHWRGDEKFSQCKVGNNHAHGQSEGCNALGMTHSSFLDMRSLVGSIGARGVFTYRRIQDCCFPSVFRSYMDGIAADDLSAENLTKSKRRIYHKYDYENVFHKRRKLNKGARLEQPLWYQNAALVQKGVDTGGDGVFEAPVVGSFTTMSELQSFHHRKVLVDGKWQKGVALPARTVQMPFYDRGTFVKHHAIVASFLAKGKVPLLVKDGVPSDCQPIHLHKGAPLRPFQRLSGQDVPYFKSHDRQNPILNPKKPLLWQGTQKYKNGCYIFDIHLEFYRRLSSYLVSLKGEDLGVQSQKEARAKLEKAYHSLPLLPFGGSGGSQQSAGNKTFTASRSGPMDANYKTAFPQKIIDGNENETMTSCQSVKQAVALILNASKWLEDDRDVSFFQDPDKRSIMLDVNLGDVLSPEELSKTKQGLGWLDHSAFLLFDECNIGDHEDDDDAESSHFLFMNYYKPVCTKVTGQLTFKQIGARFQHMPRYASRNLYNTSFLCEDHLFVYLEPAFTFEQVIQFCSGGDTYDPIRIQDDKAPIKCDNAKLFSHLEKKLSAEDREGLLQMMGKKKGKKLSADDNGGLLQMVGEKKVSNYPSELVSGQDIIGYLGGCDFEELKSTIEATQETKSRIYNVDVDEVPYVMMATMVAASFRIDKSKSTCSGKKGLPNSGRTARNKKMTDSLEVVPLVGGLADNMVDPLRARPVPCSNRDMDPTTCLFRSCMDSVLQVGTYSDICGELSPHPSFPGSFLPPDFESDQQCKVVGDAIFMSVINRLYTPTVVSSYRDWAKKNNRTDTISRSGKSKTRK